MSEAVIQFVPRWSFSALSDFEKCPMMVKLKRIDKIPEPERPLPPGKTEHANDRGSRIHDSAEQFVRGKGPLIPEMRRFETEFYALKNLFDQGKVTLEQEWGTDHDWNPCAWSAPEVWQRLKLDAMVHLSKYEGIVIDYKTGKRFGNEIKHTEQTQLYAINAFLRFPELEEVTTELWYLDVDEMHPMTYLRHQALRFRDRWHSRATKMTTATSFPAKPNIFNCKYCGYKPVEKGGTGHCSKGV